MATAAKCELGTRGESERVVFSFYFVRCCPHIKRCPLDEADVLSLSSAKMADVLFNYLIRQRQKFGGKLHPDSARRFEIDYQFESCRCFKRQIGGFRAP